MVAATQTVGHEHFSIGMSVKIELSMPPTRFLFSGVSGASATLCNGYRPKHFTCLPYSTALQRNGKCFMPKTTVCGALVGYLSSNHCTLFRNSSNS